MIPLISFRNIDKKVPPPAWKYIEGIVFSFHSFHKPQAGLWICSGPAASDPEVL